ncbi:MAG: MBOAT family protein [Nibricoccus sp.]
MVFSSPLFLFLFLPLVMLGLILPRLWMRNLWLLVFSLIFYAWGEVAFIFLMLASTVLNYFLGLWVDRENEPARRKWAVTIAIILNIGTLGFFKYANFFVDNLNALLSPLGVSPFHIEPVRLPIGISFFTFHALSYVIDVYRRKWVSAKNPADVALYIFFFPQLIAGPILRWSAIAPQIAKRVVTRDGFADGIRRFVGGLAKKMIIANAVAVPVDAIFALPPEQCSASLAWLGVACYTLQIYFDFSGYSDMAVGLGKMFGFQFLENFNFPYIAQSVTDFWRRWHISLSSWFRDYLYIPMGGNRVSAARNYFNLLTVFFLCGLWHGASWTFVIWGLYNGAFLIIERLGVGAAVERLPRPLRHVYLIAVVMVGWLIFRADSVAHIQSMLTNLVGLNHSETTQPLARYLTKQVTFALITGAIFSTPFWSGFKTLLVRVCGKLPEKPQTAFVQVGAYAELLLIVLLLAVSSAWMAGNTYNPFIYYRF